MNPSTLPPLPLPGWTLLARGEQENDMVARCPAGHIHLDYGNFTVRFQNDEFLAFARMVAEAAVRLDSRAARLAPGDAWLRSSSIGFSPN